MQRILNLPDYVSHESLNLKDQKISDQHVTEIVQFLNIHPEITTLDLSKNLIEDEGAQIIAANMTLLKLDLSWNEIGNAGAQFFAANATLSSLNLSQNRVGTPGARALAVNTTLSELILTDNLINPEGAQALAANTTLLKLDLSHNRIAIAGAKAFAANTTLSWLNLTRNSIDDTSAQALAANTTLTHLDLKGNRIGDKGAQALAANKTLLYLNLKENPRIGSVGIQAFAANKTLSELILPDSKNDSHENTPILDDNKTLPEANLPNWQQKSERVNHDIKNEPIKKQNRLVHGDLSVLSFYLKFSRSHSGGRCYGLSCMLMQACLANNINQIFAILDLLSNFKYCPETLVSEINKAKELETGNQKKSNCELISRFFRGMQAYHSPEEIGHMFPDIKHVTQSDFQTIFELIKPASLKGKEVDFLLDQIHVFTRDSATCFFGELADIFKKYPSNVPMILRCGSHAIYLHYDIKNFRWLYVDINDFERYPEENHYFRELDTQYLAVNIFTSFETHAHAVFNTRIASIQSSDSLDLKNKLQILNLKYSISGKEVNLQDGSGTTVFSLACQYGHLNMVKDLITKGAIINLADNNGFSPLFLACQNAYLDIVEILVEKEANVNCITKTGATPLYIASQRNLPHMVNFLLKNGARIDLTKNDGFGPFHIASHEGHLEILEILLESKGSCLLNVVDKEGNTPLQIACLSPCTRQNKLLFEFFINAGINLSYKNRKNQTALEMAIMNGNQAAMILLFEKYKQEFSDIITPEQYDRLTIGAKRAIAANIHGARNLLASYISSFEKISALPFKQLTELLNELKSVNRLVDEAKLPFDFLLSLNQPTRTRLLEMSQSVVRLVNEGTVQPDYLMQLDSDKLWSVIVEPQGSSYRMKW